MNGVVWDNLNEQQKRAMIRARLDRGSIIHMHCTFTTPPKSKFLVYLGNGEGAAQVGVLVINSGVREFARLRLPGTQAKIKQIDHPFLDHDSYVDCSFVHPIDVAEIEAALLANAHDLKTPLSEEARNAIIAASEEAKTLSPAEKRLVKKLLPEATE